MCFSPQADLVGGAIISAIGVGCIHNAREHHGHIALAALPLILGIHQIIEAFVWLGLQGHVQYGLERIALWAYLLIAFVLLPIYVPVAVLLNEPIDRRRRAMAPLVLIGVVLASILFAAMLFGPVDVHMHPHHLAYGINLRDGGLVVVFYVIAVCGALLLSSRRRVLTFGILNLVAIAIIAWLTIDGFASIWCAWAAILSGAIALHLRIGRPHRARPLAPSATGVG